MRVKVTSQVIGRKKSSATAGIADRGIARAHKQIIYKCRSEFRIINLATASV